MIQILPFVPEISVGENKEIFNKIIDETKIRNEEIIKKNKKIRKKNYKIRKNNKDNGTEFPTVKQLKKVKNGWQTIGNRSSIETFNKGKKL